MNCSMRAKASGQMVSSRPVTSISEGSSYRVRHLRPSVEVSSGMIRPCRISMQV